MRIQLSDHFDYRRLMKFVLPSIIMMICTSVYGVVDGFFVSNFVGKSEFAAVNLVMPLLMGLGTIGFMIGTGGSAVIAFTLGEKKEKEAKEHFTLLVITGVVIGIILSIIGLFYIKPLSIFLGATGELVEYCVIYGSILIVAIPAFILQNVFQSFFIVAEKPELGLKLALLSGVTNIALDFILIYLLQWGLIGAALATALGQVIGGVIPLFYFARKNQSLLQFIKPKFRIKIIGQTFLIGSSELITNLS